MQGSETRAGSPVAGNHELVSIVIPVFNGARYLGEAIRSALGQTWPAVEVIVVNDGSDDGGATQRVIESFGTAVRVIVKPNGGVATALNAGIAAMRGAWFSWLSHDDLYLPRKIERYMEVLATEPEGAVAFGDTEYIDGRGELLHRAEFTRGFCAQDDPRWNVLEGRINGCAMLIPRVCLEACGPFDPALPTTQDYAYWFRMASRYPLIPVREALVRGRVHSEQGSRHSRHLEEANLLWVWMLECLDAEDSTPAVRKARLYRVLKFLRVSSYAGARAYVEARLGELLADAPVALVCAADDGSAGAALQSLAAAGGACKELMLIDRAADADTALRIAATRWPISAVTIRLPGAAAHAASAVRAALRHSRARLLVFLDLSLGPIDAQMLRDALLAVDCGAVQSANAGDVASPGSSWLGPLRAAVIDRDAAAECMQIGDDAAAMRALLSRLAPSSPPSGTVGVPPRALPPAVERGAVGQARLPLSVALRPTCPTLLIVVHGWGGGTIRYAETLAQLHRAQVNVLFGWGVAEETFFLSSVGAEAPEIAYRMPAEMNQLSADLRDLQVARVDVMHTIGMDTHLEALIDRLGVPFDLTFLDYHQVATQPHLVDETGVFVGDDALAGEEWPFKRSARFQRLRAADRLIACSRDLASRIERLAPGLRVLAVRLPEPGNPERFALHAPPLADGEELRVLCLGRFAPHKGASIVMDVAELLRTRGLRIRIDWLGGILTPPPLDMLMNPHVRLLGEYRQGELNAWVCRLRPHLAWLPFSAPETHSFALSEVMLQGLPILSTGLGAVAERLFGRPASWVLTPEEVSAENIVNRLEALQRQRMATPARWLPVNHLPPLSAHFYEREYLRPLAAS